MLPHVGDGHLFEMLRFPHSRTIHEHVNTAKTLKHVGDHRLHRRFVAEIGLERFRLHAE